MVIAEADGIEDMEEIDEEANQEMDTTTSSKEETADKTETSGGEAETSGGEEKKEEDKNELTVTVKDKEKQELEDKIPFPESLKKCKCSQYFIYSIIRFKFLPFQDKSKNRDPSSSLNRSRFLELFWNRKTCLMAKLHWLIYIERKPFLWPNIYILWPGCITQSVVCLTHDPGVPVRYPVQPHTSVSPSPDSRRAVVSYW